MADRYDRTIRVPQSKIDEIKRMGMKAAIERANSGSADREFVEGARRFYGGHRVTGSTTAGEPDSMTKPPKAAPKAELGPSQVVTNAGTTVTQPPSVHTTVAKPSNKVSSTPAVTSGRRRELEEGLHKARTEFETKGKGGGRQGAYQSAQSKLETHKREAPAEFKAKQQQKETKSTAHTSHVKSLEAAVERKLKAYNEKGKGGGRLGALQSAQKRLADAKRKKTTGSSSSESSSAMGV